MAAFLHACTYNYACLHVRHAGQARAVYIQLGTNNTTYSHSGTNNTYEGPEGPGTMLLKSGTVPEIQDR